MSHPTYSVIVKWGPRIERLAEVRRKMGEYIAILRGLHRDFGAWQQYVYGKDFTPACSSWTELLRYWKPGHSMLDDEMRPDLEDLGPGGEVTGDTWSRHGFEIDLFGARPGAPGGERQDGGIYLNIQAGGNDRNEIVLDIPASRAAVHDHAFMRRLLLATVGHWEADKGAVHVPGLLKAVLDGHDMPLGEVNAGWLAYLRNAGLAACIRPIDACRTELLDDGGILFSLSDRVPDAANRAEVARARVVQSWLNGFHFHHEWTVFGWPYHPADEAYAQQVTGAPPGTVYAVGFVAFDGYDRVRKVLLFARVFALLDNRGLELDPAYREDRKKLEALPFVVQARQHIAAVRYVGAANPIEWHVGIERKARALKVLLNEWAGIPEGQLRVVFTPCEDELPMR